MSLHVLGQLGLHFSVSIVQIAAAIIPVAIVEFGVVLYRDGVIALPASAMLTGSGIGLILRNVQTQPGQHWATDGWWVFSLVALAALASKYFIRWRGKHVFNPSNLALVAAFIILGENRFEPLDFWWGPLSIWLVIAYAILLFGGFAISRNLGVLYMAVAFWVTLTFTLGVMSVNGHCMSSPTFATPVCGADFWRVVAFSPELLVFAFFMVPDPKTIPRSPASRVAFAVGVALLAAILIAPARSEFASKVGLLGALVICCGLLPVFSSAWMRTKVSSINRKPSLRIAALMSATAVACVVVVAAGGRAQTVEETVDLTARPDLHELIPAPGAERLGVHTVSPDVAEVFGDQFDPNTVASELVRSLDNDVVAFKEQRIEQLDASNDLRRLTRLYEAMDAGETPIDVGTYDLSSIEFTTVRPERQSVTRLQVATKGTIDGQPETFIFFMRPAENERWLVVETRTDDFVQLES